MKLIAAFEKNDVSVLPSHDWFSIDATKLVPTLKRGDALLDH